MIRLNLKELNGLVHSATEERQSLLDKWGIALELSPGDAVGTEAYAIDADKGRMHSVILQLLDNSLAAFEKQRRQRKIISIQTGLVVDEGRGVQALQLCYSDTAGGISKEVHRRLFDGQRVLSAKKGGSGYGLTYIYDTVRQHGGTFNFQSVPRTGTTFTIVFPLPPKGGGRDSGVGVPLRRPEPTVQEEKATGEKGKSTAEQATKFAPGKSLQE